MPVAEAGRQKADVSLSMSVVFKHPLIPHRHSAFVSLFLDLSLCRLPLVYVRHHLWLERFGYLAGERGREFLDKEGDPVAKL